MLPDTNHPRRVVDHVRSLGGLIVVEEIFTGLHRLGPEWGFPLHSIEPDIVVASKALTNGVTPLSCMWAREPLAAPDVFPPGSHSSTFAGNPLALAVVDVVLDRWNRWDRAAEDVDEEAPKSLRAVLEQIHRQAPNAQILLMGNPKLFTHDETGTRIPFRINRSELNWMNETTMRLIRRMRETAERAQQDGMKIHFSDPTPFFEGKGIGGAPEGINQIIWDRTPGDESKVSPSAQSYHPNAFGQDLYAEAMNATLRKADGL